MRSEVSALFHLQRGFESPVENAFIGSGVILREIEPAWLDEIKTQCPNVAAREQIETLRPYTHRFFYEMDAQESDNDYLNLASHEEKQLILRTIVLSRIVKPTSIGYDSVWVKSFYRDDGSTKHYHKQYLNNLNVAYLTGGNEDWNTITQADALEMARLWDSLQFLLDDINEPHYRRIVRAIKFNEFAYAIWLPEISHPTIHAALESLICTGHKYNKLQVTQRLPQLISFINKQEAEEIYVTCCGFKHEAQAMFQQKIGEDGTPAPSDQKRIDAVKLLRRAIRELLIRALRDRSFADILADKDLLKQHYPVYDSKGNVV